MSVLIETDLGDITIDLFIEQAPLLSQNFIDLCLEKYYHNSLFIDIQTNKITSIKHKNKKSQLSSRLKSKYGSYLPDEICKELKFDRKGLLGTSNKGPDMNTSEVS